MPQPAASLASAASVADDLIFSSTFLEQHVNAVKIGDSFERDATHVERRNLDWDPAFTKAFMKLHAFGLFGPPIQPRDCDHVVSLVPVYRVLDPADSSPVTLKVRIAANGKTANDPRAAAYGTVAMLADSSLRLVLQYALTHGLRIRQSDGVGAYLQAPADPDYVMGLELPRRLPPAVRDLGFYPGQIVRADRNYFGFQEGGRIFEEFRKKLGQ